MEKTVVLVFVLGLASSVTGDPESGLLGDEFIGGIDNLIRSGWTDIFDTAQNGPREEARGPFNPLRKALLPFLMGITLKAGSLVPVKLMLMTFIVILSLIFAKMGLAVSLLVGYLQYQEAHKKNLHIVTDKWLIPSTTSLPPSAPLHSHAYDGLSGAASEQQPATQTAPNEGPTTGLDTKRFQQYQYDPYRYDHFNNDPYRFTRYDYPH